MHQSYTLLPLECVTVRDRCTAQAETDQGPPCRGLLYGLSRYHKLMMVRAATKRWEEQAAGAAGALRCVQPNPSEKWRKEHGE